MEHTIDEERIIYKSDECMVVNKIPGEAAEGAVKEMADLPRLLSEQFGGTFTAVHRLDVPVSGCTLFARNPASLSFLNAAFAAGRVQKYYWAIIEMPPLDLAETGNLVHWLETDQRRNKSAAYTKEGPERKKAILRYRITGRGTHYLFMEIELITGRRHQIRAQLAAVGIHIKGDLKYGARRSEKSGGIRLHARSLRFPAPPGPPGTEKYILVKAVPFLRDRLWEDFEKSTTR
ncbi:RNA pseudouridine synthase [Spirochaetia bacterium]|nr:RNA pseudouridine synthase [Spirochaetia bacterium]